MQEKEAKERAKTESNLYLLTIIVLLIALLIALYLAYSVRKKLRYLLDETLHEVNIPLSTILANTKMLTQTVTNERAVLQIKRIDSAAKNLKNLLANLESNIRNELITPKKDFFNAASEISLIAADLCELYPNRKIVCSVPEFWCETDKYGFANSIKNILHNALKYSNDDVYVKLDGVNLEIVDFGIGFDAELQTAIFERYFQNDKNFEGNGIGLFVVKQYCDNSAIKIFIKQNEPKGTKFTLNLEYILKSEPNADKNRI